MISAQHMGISKKPMTMLEMVGKRVSFASGNMYLAYFNLFGTISMDNLSKIAFLHAFHLHGGFILINTNALDDYPAAAA